MNPPLTNKHFWFERLTFHIITSHLPTPFLLYTQASTPYCVKHGGGRLCATPGCCRAARGKSDFCSTHGGAKKCRTVQCDKQAIGRHDYCKPHYSAIHGSESAAELLAEEDDEDYVLLENVMSDKVTNGAALGD